VSDWIMIGFIYAFLLIIVCFSAIIYATCVTFQLFNLYASMRT